MAKGPEAFRTISEAAEEVGVPQHVLRFWETRFTFIKPMKRAGGRRFYRPADLVVLRGVRRLLHEEGYTIKGVQRLYQEQGAERFAAAASGERPASRPAEAAPAAEMTGPTASTNSTDPAGLARALSELEAAKARLDAVLRRG